MQQISTGQMSGGVSPGYDGQMSPVARMEMVGGRVITDGGKILDGQTSPSNNCMQMVGGHTLPGGLQMGGGQMVAGGGQVNGGQMMVGRSQIGAGQIMGSGGQMISGGQMMVGGGQTSGGQMMVGGGQIGGGQMIGQNQPGQFVGSAQMMGSQMIAGNSASSMDGGMVVVNRTQQMSGGQMATSPTGVQISQVSAVNQSGLVGDISQGFSDPSNVVVQGNASMVSQTMVSEASIMSQSQIGVVNQGMVDQTSVDNQCIASDSSMVSQGQVGMVSQSEVCMVGENVISDVSVVGKVNEVGVLNEVAKASECMVTEVGATSVDIDSTTVQTGPIVTLESQQNIADPGYTIQVSGTVDQSLNASITEHDSSVTLQVVGSVDQLQDAECKMSIVSAIPMEDTSVITYADGSTMEVIGTVSRGPSSDPSACVYPDSLGLTLVSLEPHSESSISVLPTSLGSNAVSPAPPSEPSICVYPISPDPSCTVDTVMYASKCSEIQELETRITTMKNQFQIECTEVKSIF